MKRVFSHDEVIASTIVIKARYAFYNTLFIPCELQFIILRNDCALALSSQNTPLKQSDSFLLVGTGARKHNNLTIVQLIHQLSAAMMAKQEGRVAGGPLGFS